jgi:hypothetical protein
VSGPPGPSARLWAGSLLRSAPKQEPTTHTSPLPRTTCKTSPASPWPPSAGRSAPLRGKTSRATMESRRSGCFTGLAGAGDRSSMGRGATSRVRRVGFEPTRPCGQCLLRASCLPFHHRRLPLQCKSSARGTSGRWVAVSIRRPVWGEGRTACSRAAGLLLRGPRARRSTPARTPSSRTGSATPAPGSVST